MHRYQEVDDYYRRQHFDFYRDYRSPFWSVTFELEITALKNHLAERGWPVYLNLCYYFTRAMQELEDFRYRLLDGRIVLYDVVHPGLTVPAPGGLFSFQYHQYDPDPERFNRRAARVAPADGVSLTESEHRNYVFFTALPGVPFTSFTHASDDPHETEPRVAFGRFRRDGGHLLVPVGLQVSHLFVDGAMVGALVEEAQSCYDNPGRNNQ